MLSENLLNKRIKEYIETGDEFLLDDEILTQIIKLIKSRYMGYVKRGIYTEEEMIELCLFQIGKDLKKYNPDRGEVSTFLTLTCKRILFNTLRDRKADKRIPEKMINSLYETYYSRESTDDDITYEDVFAVSEDPEYTGINYEKYVIKACDNIKKRATARKIKYDLKKVFIMYYQGYRQKYIADCIGISQVQVSRMLNKIRKETQRLLKEDNII